MLKYRVNTRGVPTFAYGKNPELFIIAEAPGKQEDEFGEPMVGSAGKMLWAMLKKVGIISTHIGNTIRCRPPKNRDPHPDEIRICRDHLLQDLIRVKPKAILLMGRISSQAFLNSGSLSLAKLRGWHNVSIDGKNQIPAYVTYHPSAIHYNPDIQSTIEEDLNFVFRKLNGQEIITDLAYKWRYLNTLPRLKMAITKTNAARRRIIYDWEARSLDIIGSEPVSLAWGYRSKKYGFCGYGLPLKHIESPWSPEEYLEVLLQLKNGLFSSSKVKEYIAYNAKFDIELIIDILYRQLRKLAPKEFRGPKSTLYWANNKFSWCAMQSVHTVDENRLVNRGGAKAPYSLESISHSWCAVSPDVWSGEVSDALYTTGDDGKNSANSVSIKKICKHNVIDLAVTSLVQKETERRARAENYDLGRIGILLSKIPYLLANIELNGMPVNLKKLSDLRADSSVIVAGERALINRLSSLPSAKGTIKIVRGGVKRIFAPKNETREFPINSREYLTHLFFHVLDLEPISYGKKITDNWPDGEPSIDKEFFSNYKEQLECKIVQEWRILNKLRTTYLNSWWEYAINSKDGNIHPSVYATSTTTGRLAQSKPNLQNIPTGGDLPAAKEPKKIFSAADLDDEDPWVIVSGDFSQAELRWLSIESDDKVMSGIFLRRADMVNDYINKPSKKLLDRIDFECDFHRSTAAELFGINIKNVTSEDRRKAKAYNFGFVYGMTEYGVSAGLGIPLEESRDVKNAWLGRFIGANNWFEFIESFAMKNGWVESAIGRRRHLPALLLASSLLPSKYKCKDHDSDGGGLSHAKRVARNAPIQSIASDMNIWVAILVQEYIDRNRETWQIINLIHDAILFKVRMSQILRLFKVVRSYAHDVHLFKKFDVKMKVPQEFELSAGFSYGEQRKFSYSPKENVRELERMQKEWRLMRKSRKVA